MEAYKQEFIEFMVESDVLKFGEFTLKSGRKSPGGRTPMIFESHAHYDDKAFDPDREELIQSLKSGNDVKTAKGKIAAKEKLPEEFNILKERLAQFFQTKVQMTYSPKGKGKITLQFDNEEQLERIMNALDGANS